MERKIGEIFTYKGKTYKILKATYGCRGCAFYRQTCVGITNNEHCSSSIRADGMSVIFKEINNMEIKNNQLIIDIPEGYEIDKENSTFECIKFKPIKKYLTYKEIAEKLNKDTCFFIAKSKIQSYTQYASYYNLGVANSYKQIEKILAINQLMNIAKYYNGNWRPDWSNSNEFKFYIVFDYFDDMYKTKSKSETCNNIIYFTHREDAQSVIDNPNFREILDIIYK